MLEEQPKLPKAIMEIMGIEGMEVLSLRLVDISWDINKQIEKIFKSCSIGLFRKEYVCWERRSLYLDVKDFLIDGFISIGVGDFQKQQEIIADKAVYDFYCSKRTNGNKLAVYYVHDGNMNRHIIIASVYSLHSS